MDWKQRGSFRPIANHNSIRRAARLPSSSRQSSKVRSLTAHVLSQMLEGRCNAELDQLQTKSSNGIRLLKIEWYEIRPQEPRHASIRIQQSSLTQWTIPNNIGSFTSGPNTISNATLLRPPTELVKKIFDELWDDIVLDTATSCYLSLMLVCKTFRTALYYPGDEN
ncbi:hypothetical protein DFJ77DRAFT_439185 [Powellomyces hirtus]|nr:hypothetical protein DFJ77DRAFT_439185 [Powellomyces hirtus]